MDDTPIYPTIRLRLHGSSPHPLMILAAMSEGLRASGVERDEIDRIVVEALSGDFDNILATCLKYVRVH